MSLSRRSFLVLAGTAAGATAAGAYAAFPSAAAPAASPAGDVVGKITVGYQGWFAAIGDGSPINAWWHWS
ncbi:MAG TPA: twin-arginine translocation signal domain-containing protein, partial [Pseudonocardiaceae bacterium]